MTLSSAKFLFLSGITKVERHQSIEQLRDAIATAGRWILDHTLLSNKAIALRFQIPRLSLDSLANGLEGGGICLDSDSLTIIAESVQLPGSEDAETTVSINVTFIHEDPDLRHDLPAVPG